MGDVIGHMQFTHTANYHAGIIVKNICFKIPAKINYQAMPWVTYTEPELAHVGLLTSELNKENTIKVFELPFNKNDRAVCEGETSGKIKILCDKKGIIKGVTLVGKNAGELLLPWIIAIRKKQSLRQFTDTTIPYPTLSELSILNPFSSNVLSASASTGRTSAKKALRDSVGVSMGVLCIFLFLNVFI